MKVISSLLLFAVLLVSCKDQETADKNAAALQYKYFQMENRGWKSASQNQLVDDINFTATEVPIQYYILKDTGPDELLKSDSIYEANKTERIIEFEFTHDEEKDLLSSEFTQMDYEDGVKYLSFAIEKDFYAVTSKNDTVQCAGVHFERNYKIAPYHKVMLFFSGIPVDDKIQLVYTDRIFRKGIIKFKIQDNISNLLL